MWTAQRLAPARICLVRQELPGNTLYRQAGPAAASGVNFSATPFMQ
jgi:hypothetical protein